jgi:hypothetical protein
MAYFVHRDDWQITACWAKENCFICLNFKLICIFILHLKPVSRSIPFVSSLMVCSEWGTHFGRMKISVSLGKSGLGFNSQPTWPNDIGSSTVEGKSFWWNTLHISIECECLVIITWFSQFTEHCQMSCSNLHAGVDCELYSQRHTSQNAP